MGKILAKRVLIPHPNLTHPPLDVGIKVTLLGTDVLKLEYVIVGPVGEIVLPAKEEPSRRDGLWQHTCFEAFIGFADTPAYLEYNFAPSADWAAYRFERYREGMVEALDLAAPDIFIEYDGQRRLTQTVIVDVSSPLRQGWGLLALSAVIEARDGTKSYWALAHPPGKPDFHHADCFAIELPAASGA
jgi:hypothetical protein